MKRYYYNTGGPLSRNSVSVSSSSYYQEEDPDLKKRKEKEKTFYKIMEEYEQKNKSFVELTHDNKNSNQTIANYEGKTVNIDLENFGFRAVYETNFTMAQNENIVDYVYDIMRSYKIEEEDKLKEKFLVFKKKLICVSLPISSKIQEISMSKEEILKDVVILGLCGENFYDPQRPLILTETNLKRKVILYEARGFYGYI